MNSHTQIAHVLASKLIAVQLRFAEKVIHLRPIVFISSVSFYKEVFSKGEVVIIDSLRLLKYSGRFFFLSTSVQETFEELDSDLGIIDFYLNCDNRVKLSCTYLVLENGNSPRI